jgi:ribonucleoside-diphosphate reductase alpha chain
MKNKKPDYKFNWLNAPSRQFLTGGYIEEQEDPTDRLWEIACTAQAIYEKGAQNSKKEYLIPDLATKLYYMFSINAFSLASPIWANFGRDKGLPISCNGVYVGDSIAQMMSKHAEVGMQTKYGAGTSGYFGDIRPRGSKIWTGGTADGGPHYLRMFETLMDVASQGKVRRGSFAAYSSIENQDFDEFMDFREVGNFVQNMSIGLTISDEWMVKLVYDMKNKVKGSEHVRRWAKVLRKRKETGYPYLFFSDNVNNQKPKVLKDKDIWIYASNLCTEICLPASDKWSFVCCLASMNISTIDEWLDTNAVELLAIFLDCVMQEYIDKTEVIPHMEASHQFASDWRAIGIGQLGWHSYLQSKGIPFGSKRAVNLAATISQRISESAYLASSKMAVTHGEPHELSGTGYRWLTNTAIAPTTSSSFIHGQVSPACEPLKSNYFTKDLAKGSFTWKNPELQALFDKKANYDNGPCDDTDWEKVWESILKNRGSVQHLDFLTEREKDVFKTFDEIDPQSVIDQAVARQPYLDQAASTNLLLAPDTPPKEVSALLIDGWERGLKSFYYQRSANPAQELLRKQSQEDCVACEA